jgi:hypothetical protein
VRRILTGLAVAALMAGCAADISPDNTPEQVAAAAFRAPGNSITLFTMVNNRSGSGGHTALLVNGSQQVIFDPAGSLRDDRLVERGDVLYGMNSGWVQAYKSAHARDTHHVVTQELRVTPAQAEKLLRLVMTNGAVPGAYCANSTSSILAQVEGFSQIKQTFYPVNLMEQIAQFPNVKTDKYFENDKGEVMDGIPQAQ